MRHPPLTFTFEEYFIGLAICIVLAVVITIFRQMKMDYDAKKAKPEIKWKRADNPGDLEVFEVEIDNTKGFSDNTKK